MKPIGIPCWSLQPPPPGRNFICNYSNVNLKLIYTKAEFGFSWSDYVQPQTCEYNGIDKEPFKALCYLSKSFFYLRLANCSCTVCNLHLCFRLKLFKKNQYCIIFLLTAHYPIWPLNKPAVVSGKQHAQNALKLGIFWLDCFPLQLIFFLYFCVWNISDMHVCLMDQSYDS